MINDIDTDEKGMEQCSIIDSSNKIRRRRTGTTSEVDDYCYSRNYKHKHNRSFLRYYSSALEIINEEEHQQQQQQSQWSEDEDEDENKTADSDNDDDDTFLPSSFVPRMTTTTDFCLSQRRMKKSHSVSSSSSSLSSLLLLLEEENKQDQNRIHHHVVHNSIAASLAYIIYCTAKSAYKVLYNLVVAVFLLLCSNA
mmetsp:Transcript_27109/g.31100  ORF Transcript_27109/g.31100 Transcript_27109/m.31100 type:complete len:196 (-) Transcript_27109:8-595(-)